MATYVPILDTQLDPDAPLTSQLMYQLRDNTIAIAEGASGAAYIQGMALATATVGLLPVTVSASDAVTIAVGHNPIIVNTSTTSTSYVLGISYNILCYSGALRFKCSHVNTGSGGDNSNLQLRKNGSVVATFVAGLTNTPRVVDVSVTIGDLLEWYHSRSGSGSSSLSGFSVTASDGYVSRPVYTLSSRL
jgi:hypothetical protein